MNTELLTLHYKEIFLLVNAYGTKIRNFLDINSIQDNLKKFSVYSLVIARNFLGKIANGYNIKTFSVHHSMNKPPKKFLENDFCISKTQQKILKVPTFSLI